MKNIISEVLATVSRLNVKKGRWSYLTSIDYMLKSKLYVDSLFEDSLRVSQYMPKGACNIMDLGTGCGIFAILLRCHNALVNICAIDATKDKSQSDPNFYDTSKEQEEIWAVFGKEYSINFSHYDGLKIPYPDNTFDILTAYAVIEHIEPAELDIVFSEIRRVLKPEGVFVVFKTPRKLAYMEYLAGFLGFGRHEKLYGDQEVEHLLLRNEFKVAESWKSNIVFEFPAKITNPLYWALKIMDWILYRSPVRLFAHHNNFVLKKKP
jgi:ubiquinone/menaquinone biosynthesis C-methylase UbiE